MPAIAIALSIVAVLLGWVIDNPAMMQAGTIGFVGTIIVMLGVQIWLRAAIVREADRRGDSSG